MAEEEGKDFLEEYKTLLKNREFGSNAWLDDLFQRNRLLADMQALEASDWLKETGFPQYTHMYQNGQMPIDLEVAKKDHSFLDEISLRSLFCRLEILNKCFQHKVSLSTEVNMRPTKGRDDVTRANRHVVDGVDNDDALEIALSNRWTYEPHRHRWSRSCDGDASPYSTLDLNPERPDDIDGGSETVDPVASDSEDMSDINSGCGSSEGEESKSFEGFVKRNISGDVEQTETLKREQNSERTESGMETSLNESEFLDNLAFLENFEKSSKTPESPMTNGASGPLSGNVDLEENESRLTSSFAADTSGLMDEHFGSDYQDVFLSLADLSKSLISETSIRERSLSHNTAVGHIDKEPGDNRKDDEPIGRGRERAATTTSGVGFQMDHSLLRCRRKQINLESMKPGRSIERSTTSSFSSSTLSTPSSRSSLSMASYTLQSNIAELAKPPFFHSIPAANHKNLTSTLSTRSENSYLIPHLGESVIDPATVASFLDSNKNESLSSEIPDGLSPLPNMRKSLTMYASRDSFGPQEGSVASKYCFPKSIKRQPTPPSPLLVRAADKLRGAFSFLKKIDNSGSLRRSLKKKGKRNVENAETDFIGGLVKSDIGSPSRGCISPELEAKVDELKCFSVERDQKESSTGIPENAEVSRADAISSEEVIDDAVTDRKLKTFARDKNLTRTGNGNVKNSRLPAAAGRGGEDTRGPASSGRSASIYDNMYSTKDFDKILDDLYRNIYLLDQSLVCETDEDSKSLSGSLRTPSSENESQTEFSPIKFLGETQPFSEYTGEGTEILESATLKPTNKSTTEDGLGLPNRGESTSPNSWSGSPNAEKMNPASSRGQTRATSESDPLDGRLYLANSPQSADEFHLEERYDGHDEEEEEEDDDEEKRWRYPDAEEREIRDSGVGSSLTRRPSNRRTVRWQSFQKDRPSSSTFVPDLSRLSAQQMAVLERYCLLRIGSILEKYGSISRKSWKNLMNRKQKAVCLSEYPPQAVFGVPLEVLRIRYGQALPKCVLLAMKKLRRSLDDCDGIFRKAGAKSRVQTLKDAVASDPESINYGELSVHDLADMLKAFLKELPECLFTEKFSKILTSIFKNVPKELHTESVQSCLVLMPNEHRDCLHTFMLFCHHFSKHSQVTQMNASNLALCLAPSFFHLVTGSSMGHTSKRQQNAYRKCIDEQKFVHQCLTFIIENAPFLFSNFQTFFEKCQISPVNNLANAGYLSLKENMDQQYNSNLCSARLKSLFQFVLKEAKTSSRGWSVPITMSSLSIISSLSTLPFISMMPSIPELSVEVSYKKAVDNSNPLRLWRCSIVIEAPPVEVLTRILWDRHLWDFDLIKWRRVEKIDNNMEVFQYVLNSMTPHPPRLYSELRSWKVNLSQGSCTLVCQSVEHSRATVGSSVCAEVQSSHYHIEPCGSGRCRLTLISRIDFKGYSLNWYNQMYDCIIASQLLRIALTLKNNFLSSLSNIPETKV